MSKFNAGQTIRCIRGNSPDLTVGKRYQVVENGRSGFVRVISDVGVLGGWDELRFELDESTYLVLNKTTGNFCMDEVNHGKGRAVFHTELEAEARAIKAANQTSCVFEVLQVIGVTKKETVLDRNLFR